MRNYLRPSPEAVKYFALQSEHGPQLCTTAVGAAGVVRNHPPPDSASDPFEGPILELTPTVPSARPRHSRQHPAPDRWLRRG